jgi:hypothetical protein
LSSILEMLLVFPVYFLLSILVLKDLEIKHQQSSMGVEGIHMTGCCPVVEWLTLLLHIWEIPDSDLSQRPAILTGFLWLFSIRPCKCWDSTSKLDHNCFLPQRFQLVSHVSPFHLTLYNVVTEKSIIK